jgi:hypothetical protein
VITLDGIAAWHGARRMVFANRDMLAAIAGVFFLLPLLVASAVLPTPQVTKGMDEQQLTQAVAQFYTSASPVLLALSLPMLVGYLTVLIVLLDRSRPTVGAAIALAVRTLPSYLAAQLITNLVLMVLFTVLGTALALLLPAQIAALLALLAMVYPLTRIVLTGPEMVAQRLRNPLRAIGASLSRTRGQFLGILMFLGPATMLFLVVYSLIAFFVSMALFNVTEGEAQRMIGDAISGLIVALGCTYFTAMVASTYNQLGPIDRPGGGMISPSSPS